MAKHYELIVGEKSNWEVAIFLLIDHVHPGIRAGNWFSRSSLTTSTSGVDFIYKLLGSINYVVNNTLENSISSAITSLVNKKYIELSQGDCRLTNSGLNRMHDFMKRFESEKIFAIGGTKLQAIGSLNEKEVFEFLETGKIKLS